MKKYLDSYSILVIIYLVIANVIITESTFSVGVKTLISVIPFFILFFTYFKGTKEKFYTYLFVFTFGFPFGPRAPESDFTTIATDYISYTNVSVLFLSLSLFTLLIFTFLEILRFKLLFYFLRSSILFFGIIISYSLLCSGYFGFYSSYFLTDLKPFIMYFFGTFAGLAIWLTFKDRWQEVFFGIVILLLWIFGIKTVLYITLDLVNSNNLTSFGTLPYFFIPVIFLLILLVKNSTTKVFLILLALLSSFSISRGFFIMIGVVGLFVPILYVKRRNVIRILSSYVMFVFLGAILYSLAPLLLSPSAMVFLEYKLDFFSTEMFSGGTKDLNRSTYIRVLELKNIWAGINENPITLIFGKGVGSYFEFREFSISASMLGTDAFSEDQIRLGKFFRPHTFFITALLKGGLFLLVLFSIINGKIVLKLSSYFRNSKSGNFQYFNIFSSIFCILFFFYFWIPEFLFLNGVIISYFKHKFKSHV